MSNVPTLLSAPHTVKPYRIRGYVVVAWAADPDVDDPHLFAKVRAYNEAVAPFRDVELLQLFTEKMGPDEHIIPLRARPRWLWRLRGLWLNVWRAKANRAEAKRLAAYFSPEAVHARIMKTQ